jgi:hypothetical protein
VGQGSHWPASKDEIPRGAGAGPRQRNSEKVVPSEETRPMGDWVLGEQQLCNCSCESCGMAFAEDSHRARCPGTMGAQLLSQDVCKAGHAIREFLEL